MDVGIIDDNADRARPDRPARRPRAAEFFAGIGLVRLAIERAGWNVVFANDIDPKKAGMYRRAFPLDHHLKLADIHTLSAGEVPACDLYTASFPCNDLSVAGKQHGLDGKESSAFWGLIRLIDECGGRRPALVMLENVVGFLTSRGGADLETALLALNGLGYVVDVIQLNARHWTPQSRPRLFIIARLDGDRAEPPAMLMNPSPVRPAKLEEFIRGHRNIRWDLGDYPHPPAASARLEDILEDLSDDDPAWWNESRTAYFMNQLSEKHARWADEAIASDGVRVAPAFRRVRDGRSMAELRVDGIAGCLRTPRGGSGRQMLLVAGGGRRRVRLLTARECARLQGVPDDYPIEVPLNQALFGFGDAVCVPAVEWIFRVRLNGLAKRLGLGAPGSVEVAWPTR